MIVSFGISVLIGLQSKGKIRIKYLLPIFVMVLLLSMFLLVSPNKSNDCQISYPLCWSWGENVGFNIWTSLQFLGYEIWGAWCHDGSPMFVSLPPFLQIFALNSFAGIVGFIIGFKFPAIGSLTHK
jgi:hypothetical protein